MPLLTAMRAVARDVPLYLRDAADIVVLLTVPDRAQRSPAQATEDPPVRSRRTPRPVPAKRSLAG